MKKYLLIILLCLFACGCNSNKWEVSELSSDGGTYLSNLQGDLKNKSDENCKKVQINFIAQSGSLKVEGWVWVDNPELGKTKSFDSVIYGDAGDVDNLENYTIKLKNIECWITK